MMKKIIIILLFQIPIYCFSQNEILNEAKYWVLRDRLVNDFMVPGECNGCGIVFKSRGHAYNTQYPENSGHWIGGGFDISDEGFELGYYLIVLATEWKLLYNSGLDRTKTELEIYYALKTIDRLDYTAEWYWSQFHWQGYQNPPQGSTNGFMIKDDVFENFIETPNAGINTSSIAFKHYQYLNQGGNKGKYHPQNILKSDGGNNQIFTLEEMNEMQEHFGGGCFSAASAGLRDSYPYSLDPNKQPRCIYCTGPREYSQDNYIGLLQGLATVSKLVEDWAVSNNIHLSQKAKDIIDRIINSIKNNNNGALYNWMIDNPVTEKCVKGVHWSEYLVSQNEFCNAGGAEAEWFSGQFAEILNLYTGNNISGTIINGLYSSKLGAILLTLTNSKSNSNYKERTWIDNNHLQDEYAYLDLLFCVLHMTYPLPHDETERGYTYYENILNDMPCYSSDNIPDMNQKNNLHEMMIFNLLKLLKGEKYKKDLIDNSSYPELNTSVNIEFNGPHEGGGYSVNVYISPVCNQTIEAFNTIKSRAIIGYYSPPTDNTPSNVEYNQHSCAADITYKAGKSIRLLPGFKTKPGVHFVAKIEDFGQCKVRQGLYDFWEFPDIGNNAETPYIISDIVSNKCYSKKRYEENINLENDSTKLNQLIITPNPSGGKFTVNYDTDNKYTIIISNITGQIILKKQTTEKKINIDLKNINNGIYILKLIDNGNAKTRKIIIRR